MLFKHFRSVAYKCGFGIHLPENIVVQISQNNGLLHKYGNLRRQSQFPGFIWNPYLKRSPTFDIDHNLENRCITLAIDRLGGH